MPLTRAPAAPARPQLSEADVLQHALGLRAVAARGTASKASPVRKASSQPRRLQDLAARPAVAWIAVISRTSAWRCAAADARRAEHAAPVADDDVDPALLQRRDARDRCGVSPVVASARMRPALICSANSDTAGDAGAHLRAEDRRLGRAAAGEGDVGRLARVAAQRLQHQAEGDVVGAARAAAGDRDRARIGLQRVEQPREVADVASWRARR